MADIGIPGCYRAVCHRSGPIGAWVICAWHVSPCPILRSSTLEDVRCCLLDDQIRAIFDRIQPVVLPPHLQIYGLISPWSSTKMSHVNLNCATRMENYYTSEAARSTPP